ncbi:MAG: hypothetical protein OHK0053_22020 [Microscillaceae bacterium]
MDKDNVEKWLSILKMFLRKTFSFKTLAFKPESATFLVRKDSKNSILRLVDLEYYSKTQLQFEWKFLEMHKNIQGFPSQKPLNFFDISETIKGLELSYVEGHHPRANRQADFFIYGRTLAKFHQFSKGLHYDDLPTWDLERVINPFSNPVLLEYFNEKQKLVAFQTIDEISQKFIDYWQQNEWTGIIHSDTHKHNIVINGNEGCLIDFGECGRSVLFWDLGVAIADTEMDYPKFVKHCRKNLLKGYLSVFPEVEQEIRNDIDIFTKIRVLEVMTWPVSSWTEEYRKENADEARKNLEDCIAYLEKE